MQEAIEVIMTKKVAALDKAVWKLDINRNEIIEQISDISKEITRINDRIYETEYQIREYEKSFGNGNLAGQFLFNHLTNDYRRLNGWRKAYNRAIRKLTEI